MSLSLLKYFFVFLILNSNILFPEYSSFSTNKHSGLEEINSISELVFENILGVKDTNPEDEDDDYFDYQTTPENFSLNLLKAKFYTFFYFDFLQIPAFLFHLIEFNETTKPIFISYRTGILRYISLLEFS